MQCTPAATLKVQNDRLEGPTKHRVRTVCLRRSGIQLLVTSQPRKYEVGTLVLGAVGFQLPPGRPYVKLNESW